MAYKNLGPGVSQTPQSTALGDSFSGEEKSFESLVIQAAKPIIDWEMNLRGEISSDHGVRLSNSRQFPSGWINAGFLDSPDVSNAYSFLTPIPGSEDKFEINPQNIIINGWNLRFNYSDSTSTNSITLPTPPLTNYRVDLVVLEVWRALVLAAPSVANKSPTGLILRHGNVKCPDATPNFIDDLIDPVEAAETAARVQIQYRYRVISGVDVTTYPDGLTDPIVVANSVSDFTGPGADGSPTLYNYAAMTGDSGLWIAGTGDSISAGALGTVDGYMYAIPICAVFRRNSGAFSKTTNLNGGVLIAAATSDRPDGLFSDQIVIGDIKDLRKGIARDYGEVLQKTIQQVFNNSLSTEHEILTAAGPAGVSLSVKDDILNTDQVRRYFSDRSITETVVCRFDAVAPGPVTSIPIDLSALQRYGVGPINLLSIAPVGTNIVSVNKVRLVETAAGLDVDLLEFPPSTPYSVADIQYTTLVGPGIDSCTINITPYIPLGMVNFYVEISIEYPAGDGLSRNIIDSHDVWTPPPASLAVPNIDMTMYTATSDANRFSLNTSLWTIDAAHRELFMNCKCISITNPFTTQDGTYIWIPERLTGFVMVNDGVNPIYSATYTVNTAYTRVTLVPALAPGSSVSVDYIVLQPFPEVTVAPADSYHVFFQSRAIQSLLPASGNQTLRLIPRTNPDNLYVITSGSGSPDDSFPFESPSAQIPVGLLPSATYPESRLDNPNPVSIIGFGVNTGFIKLDAKVPYMPDSNAITLYKSAPDVVTDGDGRNFWPKSDDGITPVYSPVIFGHLLTASQRHKTAAPVLMELAEDVPYVGRKGTLVLVVLTNWLEFSDENTIQLSSVLGSSCAAVYRVRGHLINPQRTVV